jgi:L-lysine 2,3-aminomutase
LAQVLTRYRFKPIIVTHFNHPKEITEPSRTAIDKLKDGMTLLNQSVLLKGVNDSAETLSELSERLFEIGILPYYLHQLDPSKGTGHFRVDLECGKRIWEELRVRLPGYLVPRYVMDVVESPFKVEVDRMMSAR